MKTNFFLSVALLLCTIILYNGAHSRLIAQGVKVVVIDAGHGGKISPGATYKGVMEKNLVLPIALRVGELVEKNIKGVKVVYTRKSDVSLKSTIAADLKERNRIANSSNGDLFISIHANAAASAAASGVECIVMGESSLEQQRNESAIYTNRQEELLDMSDEKTAAIVRAYIQNLQFTYGEYSEAFAQLIQKHYGTYGRKLRPLRRQLLMVLYGADMPAVLTEIGFMTNTKEFAYMTSKKGKEEIAQSIYKGIRDYVEMVNGTVTMNQKEVAPKVETQKTEVNAPKSGYAIQIMASGSILKEGSNQFKSYKGKEWYFEGSAPYKYKYCVGRFATRAEALRELPNVKKVFKSAFVIKY